MTRPATVEAAVAAARNQSAHGPRFGDGECKQRVRELYNVPSDGAQTASIAWTRTDHKHTAAAVGGLDHIPRGALVWWTGGTPLRNYPAGAGHVALSAGGGWCWSTDIRRTGYFDKVLISSIARTWPRLRWAGWSEDIDGVRCISWARPTGPVRGTKLDAILELLHEVTRADALDEVERAVSLLESIPKLAH